MTRLGRLRRRLADDGVDGLVVTNLVNVRYLTGFTGSAAVLAVTPDAAVLTTDGRYRTQSAEEVRGPVEIAVGGVSAQRDAVKGALASAHRVGLEADHVTWAASRRWGELFGEVVPTSGLVEGLREVKDAAEVDLMARAAAIADAALGEVLPGLVAGATEASFALALDSAMRRRGAEGTAFETIVASGPNSAKPHHRPGDRTIGAGDPVVVDFGAAFQGYRSDMTRTFCVGGEPEGELARVFEVVREAQARGVATVAPGVAAKDVDAACREVIGQAGWADAFEHGTGHGVGLDVHEAPTVSPLATAILVPGMIVTVEPGVYLPGTGGVRIEDTLVVTEDGCRPLTAFDKAVAV
ncbi:MAG: M24 family metallopeptidase [Acidimicrobiales bacterium]